MPLTRELRRHAALKKVSRRELNWRNLKLITKFVNPSGRIYNRYQTCLETQMQKRLVRVVKMNRILGLLPTNGSLKPYDKLDLKPLAEELHRFDLKSIDAQVGVLIYREPPHTYGDMVMKGENMDTYRAKKPYF